VLNKPKAVRWVIVKESLWSRKGTLMKRYHRPDNQYFSKWVITYIWICSHHLNLNNLVIFLGWWVASSWLTKIEPNKQTKQKQTTLSKLYKQLTTKGKRNKEARKETRQLLYQTIYKPYKANKSHEKTQRHLYLHTSLYCAGASGH